MSRWFRGWGEPVTLNEHAAIAVGIGTFFAFVQAARAEHSDAVAENRRRMAAWRNTRSRRG